MKINNNENLEIDVITHTSDSDHCLQEVIYIIQQYYYFYFTQKIAKNKLTTPVHCRQQAAPSELYTLNNSTVAAARHLCPTSEEDSQNLVCNP